MQSRKDTFTLKFEAAEPNIVLIATFDLVLVCQLDCSPSLQTEPQLQLEAAMSTTGFAKFTFLAAAGSL